MNSTTYTAIAALMCTSLLVRVIPAFVDLRMSDGTRAYLERLLPTAVFINFAVYIACTEIARAPLAATASLGLLVVLATLLRMGLIGSAVISTVLYFALDRWV